MAYKKVSGSRTAEIQLDGSVYTVNFGYSYNYYAVRNDSRGTIYVSTADKSCTPNNDGVVSVPSGGGYVHYNGFGGSSEIYISGTGGVLVVAQDDGVCPFKSRGKGGDTSGGGGGLETKIVAELPEVGDSKYLYLVPKTDLLSGNLYDEYLWIDGTYEPVGSTSVDLSDYATINNLTSHTDNKNNPHEVKPLQIKKDDFILHRGKTVAEFKSELLNWWNSACGTLSVYRFSGGTVPWWLENFKNDEEIIPAGATYTIIPVADYAPDKRYATFLFSAASNSKGSNEILKLELFNGQFVYLSKLVDLSDYATIEQLNGKQDIITKPPITDNSVDWNTLTETAIYPVGIQNGEGLSESSTHGLSSAYHYGFLIVMARLNYNGWLYQLYISNRSEVYIRSLYTSWSSWTRIDGRVTGIKGESETEYRKGNVNISQSNIGLIFDGLVLKNKTVGEAKEIIVNTYLSNFSRFGVFMNIPSDLIYEWDTNDHVCSYGGVCQITPIGTVTKGTVDGELYGRFLISGYNKKIYFFDISNSVCMGLTQILTSNDITPEMIEKLKNL